MVKGDLAWRSPAAGRGESTIFFDTERTEGACWPKAEGTENSNFLCALR